MDKCKVIAITNQKGGVGKTTTTVNLGVGLAQAGYKAILVDADPQGSLTISLGIMNPDELPVSLATIMQKVIDDQTIAPQDGLYDHVGIVEKVENGRVYTIEGNSGDSCRRRDYPLDYYEILGYGIPAY